MKKTILCLFASVSLLASFAFAQQNTLTQTTLSAAIAASDTTIQVASATGINAPSISTQRSMLYVIDPGATKGEPMLVTGVSGTQISVRRTSNKTTAHATSALVLIGQPNYFYSTDPTGACTLANTYVSPWVNTDTGRQWLCSSVTLSWVPGFNNTSAPAQVTTAVASAAGKITPSGPLFHITGTAAITGFNVPIGFSGGTICAVPDAIFTTTNANNIALASTGVVSKTLCWTFDSNAAKGFFPSY